MPDFAPHRNFHGAVGKSERAVQDLRAQYKRPEPKFFEGDVVFNTLTETFGMIVEDATYIYRKDQLEYPVLPIVKRAKQVVVEQDKLENGWYAVNMGIANWVQTRLESEAGEWDWYGR